MQNESWRTDIESVRQRFENGADQHADLTCVLVHWGANDLPIDERFNRYPHGIFNGTSGRAKYEFSGETDYYRVRRKGSQVRIIPREYYFLSPKKDSEAAVAVFRRQATEAARCLHDIPESILNQFHLPSRKRHQPSNSHMSHWVWFLFDMVWQQPIGSARYVSRTIWGFADGEGPRIPESIHCFPYDQEFIRDYYQNHKAECEQLSFLQEWVTRLPKRYMGCIPDVFSYSVWAINQLLSTEPQMVDDKSPRDEQYLGIDIDTEEHSITRNECEVAFGRKYKAWRLFCMLYRAGASGESLLRSGGST